MINNNFLYRSCGKNYGRIFHRYIYLIKYIKNETFSELNIKRIRPSKESLEPFYFESILAKKELFRVKKGSPICKKILINFKKLNKNL